MNRPEDTEPPQGRTTRRRKLSADEFRSIRCRAFLDASQRIQVPLTRLGVLSSTKPTLAFPSDTPAVLGAAAAVAREATAAHVDVVQLVRALSCDIPSPTWTDEVHDWIAQWPAEGDPSLVEVARGWLGFLATCFRDVWFMEPDPAALRKLLGYVREFWDTSHSEPLCRTLELTIQHQFRILWLVTARDEIRAVRKEESRIATELFFDIIFRTIYRLLGTDLDSDTRDDHASAIAQRLVDRMLGCQRRELLFENPYALRAYLKTVVGHQVLESKLAEQRRRVLLEQNKAATRSWTIGEATLGALPQRCSLASMIEQIKELATFHQLQVFELHLAGLTAEQIGLQLNISTTAVQMRLSRLRERAEEELIIEEQQP
jgi:DNA-directed RNA polymerase specialized sigma24 family protein